MAKRVTMADVARLAKVSLSTASLSFSDSSRVSEDTRARVLAAAEELSYHGPNPLGRQLRSGRSGIVGVNVGSDINLTLRDPFSLQVLAGVSAGLASRGLGILLLTNHVLMSEQTDLARTAAMDAAIALWGTSSDSQFHEILASRGIPLIAGQGPTVEGVPSINPDDRRGSSLVAKHLKSLGHERIALLTLPLNYSEPREGFADAERLALTNSSPTMERIAGVEDLGISPHSIYEASHSLVECGLHAGEAFAKLPEDERPTAIMAQSDQLAVGLIQALTEAGIRVPEDISVTGYDGIDLPWLPYRLTTVYQDGAAKGEAMAELAMLRINKEPVPPEVKFEVTLTIGSTTGPA